MAKYGKTKNDTAHEEWVKGKKIGRPKQVWVWNDVVNADGTLGGNWYVNGK